jgi:hypothetical protein
MIDYLLPRGGARGTVVEVEFHGYELQNPRQVLFYQPGIAASNFAPYAKPGDGFKAKFQIAPDCPLGEHVLRVLTATGLTDAVTFWVSPFPTIYEMEAKIGEDDTPQRARAIPINVTVEGQILPGQDMDKDFYRIEARQGQRISVEVEAARLGTLHNGGENDLMVRILDADGKEIGRCDDDALYVQDPVLSVIAPRTGSYFVEIQQQIFYPPQQAWYRAHIGTFTRPTAIFPAGGQAGTTLEARILGDPTGERTETIALPSKPDERGNFDYYSGKKGETPPSPNVLRVSPFANVLYEKTAGQPTPVPTLPIALNGILDQPGETQVFRISAKKGQQWRVQVFARTLGAPVDPKLSIRAPDGKTILEADDARMADLGEPSVRGTWHSKDQLDPVAIFKPPTDGDYLIAIADTTAAAGPDHVYRVEISPVRNAVYTHITMNDGYQMPRLTGLIVPRGSRWTLDVQLAEGLGNGYKGEIELEAIGMPPGVTMIAPRFPKGVMRIAVQFVAAPDARPTAALIQLLARPVDKTVQLDTGSRMGFGLINRPGELPWHLVFLRQYALAVIDPPPFDIDLVPSQVPLAQSADLALQVKVRRHGDFKGPIEIQPDWLPPGVSKGPVVAIPPDKDEAAFTIQANDKAALATYKVAMNASTTAGDAFSGIGRIRVSSNFADLKVVEPYVSVDLERGSVERGKQAELVGVLRQRTPFPGKAQVKLQQLPKGVSMVGPAPEITSASSQVVFRLAANDDALAGLYKGLTCEISFTQDGQTIHQRTGSGVLRVDQPKVSQAR